MAFAYPVMLEVRDRPCVVVGGGSIGEGKIAGLLAAGAAVTVIDPEPLESVAALAEEGVLSLERRVYRDGDLEGVLLAIAATDDSATNAAIFAEAERRKVLMNAVDDPEYCHFAVPALVRRGDLLLTLSTGGRAPALAKSIRRRLSTEFGEEYGTLVDLLAQAREEALPERERLDFGEWAARWERALRPDLIGMIRQGRHEQLKAWVVGELTGRSGSAVESGHVWIVGAGPGAPDLITVRGRRALEEADVVVYDRLVDPALVEGKEGIYVGKQAGRHSVPQDEINATLIREAKQGRRVVRLKGGDPFVFGRGGEEAEALASEGIGFTVVPGPTSAIAAVAAAGIPVTDRRFSSSVALATGHCGGDRPVDFAALARSVETVVVLMGLARLPEIVAELRAGGLDAATPAAVIENGTLPSQRVVVADLAGIVEAANAADVSSPALVVVGEVVGLRERIGGQRSS